MKKYLSIDIARCTNCRICEIWCSFTKTGECGPEYSRIKLYPIDKEGITVPNVCIQCEEACCATVCPTRALKRDVKTGAVILDYERCIGCRACIFACPFGAIFMQPDGKIVKCDQCLDLPEPVCVMRCPYGALRWEKPENVALPKRKTYSLKLSAAFLLEDEASGEYVPGEITGA